MQEEKPEEPDVYLLWGDDDQISEKRRGLPPIPAPKITPPGYKDEFQ